MEVIRSYETPADFTGLHGVTSQKAELFITTDVGTSNPKDQPFIAVFVICSLTVISVPVELRVCMTAVPLRVHHNVTATSSILRTFGLLSLRINLQDIVAKCMRNKR
jgi:hypothetical protein